MVLEVLGTIVVGVSIPALYFSACKRKVKDSLRARNATSISIHLMPPTIIMEEAHAELTCYAVVYLDEHGKRKTAHCWVTPFSSPYWEEER
jgi:hypothetical protein